MENSTASTCIPITQGRGIGKLLVAAIAGSLEDNGFSRLMLWVLAANPARDFYERIGGALLKDEDIEIKGQTLRAVSYGWDVGFLLKETAGHCEIANPGIGNTSA